VIPNLDTVRLTLRAHTLADFDEYAAMWADPLVTRHIGGKPFTREDSWSRFLRFPGHWSLLGFGCWVVREKGTGRFVGDVGLFNMKRELKVPSFVDAPEAGWAFAPAWHGLGVATEAMEAVLDWFDRKHKATRTVCMINPENAASIRVAQKIGYREYTRSSYKNEAVILYERG
jgi:RimJ/RimL family protein N-acetyltransferase